MKAFDKLSVGVMFGGRSVEHDVSVASGFSIVKALLRLGPRVVLMGIDHDGAFKNVSDSIDMMATHDFVFTDHEKNNLLKEESLDLPITRLSRHDVDVVIPMLHGSYGEDGRMQGFLDTLHIPYVGSSVLPSALLLDKIFMKSIFRDNGFSTSPWVNFSLNEWNHDSTECCKRVTHNLQYPVFIKPSNTGSSFGIRKVRNDRELSEAIAFAFTHDQQVIVEQGIDCYEVECSVLGNDDPRASLPGQIIPRNEFYDYESKYLPSGMTLKVPAPFSSDLTEKIQKMAIDAFKLFRCAGLARVDFFVEKTTEKLFVNELNTIPGFTATSVYAVLWEHSGLTYDALLTELINLAMQPNVRG